HVPGSLSYADDAAQQGDMRDLWFCAGEAEAGEVQLQVHRGPGGDHLALGRELATATGHEPCLGRPPRPRVVADVAHGDMDVLQPDLRPGPGGSVPKQHLAAIDRHFADPVPP